MVGSFADYLKKRPWLLAFVALHAIVLSSNLDSAIVAAFGDTLIVIAIAYVFYARQERARSVDQPDAAQQPAALIHEATVLPGQESTRPPTAAPPGVAATEPVEVLNRQITTYVLINYGLNLVYLWLNPLRHVGPESWLTALVLPAVWTLEWGAVIGVIIGIVHLSLTGRFFAKTKRHFAILTLQYTLIATFGATVFNLFVVLTRTP